MRPDVVLLRAQHTQQRVHLPESFLFEPLSHAWHLRATPSQYNGVWHCAVGSNFGAYTTYEEKHFCYFYAGQQAVLLFKTG